MRAIFNPGSIENVLDILALHAKGVHIDPFSWPQHCMSAFHEAAASGNVAFLDAVATIGRDRIRAHVDEPAPWPNSIHPHPAGSTALGACATGHSTPLSSADMVRKLLELGAHPDGSAELPGHPMAQHILAGDLRAVEALIAAGADLSIKPSNESFLRLALRRPEAFNAERMVDLLLARGLDPHETDANGLDPFQAAHPVHGDWIRIHQEKRALAHSSPHSAAFPTSAIAPPRL